VAVNDFIARIAEPPARHLSDADLLDSVIDKWSWERQSATVRLGLAKLIAASTNPDRDAREEWNRRSISVRQQLQWSLIYGPSADEATRAAAEEEARVAAEADEATVLIFQRMAELEGSDA
jgi:hypothetical protein